jgi:hypothetical protein
MSTLKNAKYVDPSEVYKYLTQEKGLSHNHAVGMITNIKYESGFNAAAVGDNGNSIGLFQHNTSRMNALKNYAGDDWTNWKKQIDYALTEKDTKRYLNQEFNTPENASIWFTLNWERPTNKEQKAQTRAMSANTFHTKFTTGETPKKRYWDSEDSETIQDEFTSQEAEPEEKPLEQVLAEEVEKIDHLETEIKESPEMQTIEKKKEFLQQAAPEVLEGAHVYAYEEQQPLPPPQETPFQLDPAMLQASMPSLPKLFVTDLEELEQNTYTLGGVHGDPPPVPQGATLDSLLLYNHAVDKRDFYKSRPGYKNVSAQNRGISNDDIPFLISEIENNAGKYNQDARSFYKDTKKFGSEQARFYKQGNLYSFGDILIGRPDAYYNTEAPPIYLHPTIMPQGWRTYAHTEGDVSDVPYYDPTKMWPKSMGEPPKGYTKYPLETEKPYVPNLDTDLAAWLKTQGAPTSYAERKRLYKQATGRTDYKGTAEQNIGLLNLLKENGLDYKFQAEQQQPTPEQTPTLEVAPLGNTPQQVVTPQQPVPIQAPPQQTIQTNQPQAAQVPSGYNVWTHNGQPLDPQIYGYAPSTSGPRQISQFADTHALKRANEFYTKIGATPWATTGNKLLTDPSKPYFTKTAATNAIEQTAQQLGVETSQLQVVKAPAGYTGYVITQTLPQQRFGGVFQDGGTVSELYTQKTGLPWATAKEQGLTDGSYESNIQLRNKLLQEQTQLQTSEPTSSQSAYQTNVRGMVAQGKTLDDLVSSKMGTREGLTNMFPDLFSGNQTSQTVSPQKNAQEELYYYKGRPEAKYIKKEDGWYINLGDKTKNTFVKIDDPTGKRTQELEKNATKDLPPTGNKVKLKSRWADWEEVKTERQKINTLPQEDVIRNYYKNSKEEYLVLDKKTGKLKYYKGDQEVESYNVGVGENKGDQQTKTAVKDGKVLWDQGNKTTGAGVYTVSGVNKFGGAPSWTFKNEQGIEVPMALHASFGDRTKKIKENEVVFHYEGRPESLYKKENGVWHIKNKDTKNVFVPIKDSKGERTKELDRNAKTLLNEDIRLSNGCINGVCMDLDRIHEKGFSEGKKMYILPEEEGNRFKITGGTLAFQSKDKDVNRTTASINSYKDIRIDIDKNKLKSFGDKAFSGGWDENQYKNIITPYTKSLSDNKRELMKLTGIDNDTYNDIAAVAFGILGVESNFGDTHSAAGNLLRAGAKAINPKGSSSPDYKSKFNTYRQTKESNSVGLTQIRFNMSDESEKQLLQQVGITSNSDLLDPSKAAIATMAILIKRYQNQLDPEKRQDILTELPKTWNKRDNYSDRVKEMSRMAKLKEAR